MNNWTEIKKVVVISVSIIIVFSMIFVMCLVYQYNKYTDNFNKTIGAIVTSVENKYPNVDKNELFNILNGKDDIDTNVFEEYGIDISKESIILKNDKLFTEFLFVDLFLIIGTAIVVMIIFIK